MQDRGGSCISFVQQWQRRVEDLVGRGWGLGKSSWATIHSRRLHLVWDRLAGVPGGSVRRAVEFQFLRIELHVVLPVKVGFH